MGIVDSNKRSNTISYIYDGDGSRVLKNADGVITRYLTDTLNPTGYSQTVEELNGAYGVQKRYVYGLDLVSVTDTGSGKTYYYGYDGTGSTRLLTNEDGGVSVSYDYDAFGTLIYTLSLDPGTLTNSHLFHGEQYDEDLNLYYLRARWMSTDIGRFWSMDEFEGMQEDPASLHKYTFTANNPVNLVDPSGMYSYASTVGAVAVQSVMSFQTVIKIAEAGVIATLLYQASKTKMRAYHYTDDMGYEGINRDGFVGFRYDILHLEIPMFKYYSPQIFDSGEVAKSKLALRIKPTWRLGLDIYPVRDFFTPPFPIPVTGKYKEKGGGWQLQTFKNIPLHGRNHQWVSLY